MTKQSSVKPLSELLGRLNPEVVAEAEKEAAIEVMEFQLKTIREELGISQSALAESLGKKQPTIANIEKSGSKSKIETIMEYLSGLGCKISIDVEMPTGEKRHLFL